MFGCCDAVCCDAVCCDAVHGPDVVSTSAIMSFSSSFISLATFFHFLIRDDSAFPDSLVSGDGWDDLMVDRSDSHDDIVADRGAITWDWRVERDDL